MMCRFIQIRTASSRNIVVHGLEAAGKSVVTKAVLDAVSTTPMNQDPEDEGAGDLRYAIVRSAECIGGRHLLEQTVGAVAKAIAWRGSIGRCENIAQLLVELGRLIESWTSCTRDEGRRKLVLVFDAIDHQRDAPPTLLPALARLGEGVGSPRRNSQTSHTNSSTDPLHYLHIYCDLPTTQFFTFSRCSAHPFP